ncbi:MAG: ribosome silencing factor [Ruminococcaceae bacterium]|nr:ribosome silencing factor [Oscillospiraceae bacterium]
MLTEIQVAQAALKALEDKKAANIKILKTTDVTVLADYFIICTATSGTHVKSLSEEVERVLTELGEEPRRREGKRSDSWVLLDYACVIVHIFTKDAREFYNLEKLWADAKEVLPSSL